MKKNKSKRSPIRSAERKAARKANRTGQPVAVGRGQIVHPAKAAGRFVKAKAVRVRRVGREVWVDIQR